MTEDTRYSRMSDDTRYTDEDLSQNAETRAEPVADCVEKFSDALNTTMRSLVQSDEYALFAARPLFLELEAELLAQFPDDCPTWEDRRECHACKEIIAALEKVRRIGRMPDASTFRAIQDDS